MGKSPTKAIWSDEVKRLHIISMNGIRLQRLYLIRHRLASVTYQLIISLFPKQIIIIRPA